MLQKKFLLVMAALVSASLVLTGCPPDAEEKTVTVTQTVPEMIQLDLFATDLNGLTGALTGEGDLRIGLSASVSLTDDLTIPDGKLVYILNGGELDPSSKTLTVAGQVYVGVGGTLKASSSGKVKVTTGTVHVVKGGTLDIDEAASVTDGTTTALGAVGFAAEATLKVSGALTATELGTLWNLLSRGTLEPASLTTVKVSELVALPGISETKRLKATATTTETATGLITIPKGADITAESTDKLDKITELTVGGTFTTAAGTLEAVTALTVDGTLTASSATLAALTDLVVNGALTVGDAVNVGTTLDSAKVSGTGTLTLGTTDISSAPYAALLNIKNVSSAATTLSAALTVPATKTLTLTAAAAPSGDVTVNGSLIVPTSGSLAIDAGKMLAIADTGNVYLSGTGSVVLTSAASAGGAKITGTGKLTAGKTEIVGGTSGWQAVGTHSSGVTIAAATPTTASITGASGEVFTAQGADATITQLAGAGNSLTIAADTTIALNSVGAITLKGASTAANGGKIAFANGTSSVITTGNTGSGGSNTKIANATLTNLTLVSENTANKVVSITSTANTDCAIVTSTVSTDATIDKDTVATTT